MFALPDERLREVVGAMVFVENQQTDLTEAALQAFVAKHLAHLKCP